MSPELKTDRVRVVCDIDISQELITTELGADGPTSVITTYARQQLERMLGSFTIISTTVLPDDEMGKFREPTKGVIDGPTPEEVGVPGRHDLSKRYPSEEDSRREDLRGLNFDTPGGIKGRVVSTPTRPPQPPPPPPGRMHG